jgi:hypothetical protein
MRPLSSALSIALLAAALSAALPADVARAAPARQPAAEAAASSDVRTVARWAVQSNDARGTAFLVVDKPNARLFVFAADATTSASAPVLLGAARGDVSVPGIGTRKMSDIQPHERTTPAGRFAGEAGRNLQGEDIVWVDYDAAVSMHRVRATNPVERRLQRLATPTTADNRISYGCINVPAAFFDAHVAPLFAGGRRAMIYVLPDSSDLRDVFPLAVSIRG